jgi:hypothetical protein
VVKGGLFPIFGGVAGGAVCAKFALVGVFFGMAGETVLRGAFVNPVQVAGLALDRGVFSKQGKGGQAVVNGRLFPILGGVAGGAVCAEAALVGILPGMAGGAGLTGCF